jgi:hypothetical protein
MAGPVPLLRYLRFLLLRLRSNLRPSVSICGYVSLPLCNNGSESRILENFSCVAKHVVCHAFPSSILFSCGSAALRLCVSAVKFDFISSLTPPSPNLATGPLLRYLRSLMLRLSSPPRAPCVRNSNPVRVFRVFRVFRGSVSELSKSAGR